MGLIHPLDLGAWQRWQDSRHRAVHTLRRAREVWRPSTEPSFWIARGPGAETHPDALFVLDSPNATSRHAVLDPALRRGRQSAVVTSFDPAALLPEAWSAEPLPTTAIPELVMSTRAVVSMAHYLPPRVPGLGRCPAQRGPLCDGAAWTPDSLRTPGTHLRDPADLERGGRCLLAQRSDRPGDHGRGFPAPLRSRSVPRAACQSF